MKIFRQRIERISERTSDDPPYGCCVSGTQLSAPAAALPKRRVEVINAVKVNSSRIADQLEVRREIPAKGSARYNKW